MTGGSRLPSASSDRRSSFAPGRRGGGGRPTFLTKFHSMILNVSLRGSSGAKVCNFLKLADAIASSVARSLVAVPGLRNENCKTSRKNPAIATSKHSCGVY